MRRPETLIARGLPYGMDRCELARFFPKCRGVKIHYDRESGNSTGTAFVEFDTVQDMRQALDDHRSGRMVFRNRTFRLEHCHPKRVDIHALREQIEYAFSDENLARDPLFQELITKDHAGWIHFDDLQQCHKIKRLGAYDEDVQLAMKSSDVVEVCDNHLRRCAPFVLDGHADCRRMCTLEEGRCPEPSELRSTRPSLARNSRFGSQAPMRASAASLDTARYTNWDQQTNRCGANSVPASNSTRHTSPGRRSEQSEWPGSALRGASPCNNGGPCAPSGSSFVENNRGNSMDNTNGHAANSACSRGNMGESESKGSRWIGEEKGRWGEWKDNTQWEGECRNNANGEWEGECRNNANGEWGGEEEEEDAWRGNGWKDNGAWEDGRTWTDAHSTWEESHQWQQEEKEEKLGAPVENGTWENVSLRDICRRVHLLPEVGTPTNPRAHAAPWGAVDNGRPNTPVKEDKYDGAQ
eukprot:GEMP01057241.1.p1 GENE.GEMP01057241.1~~GEMP01057241.1.p1  ORF type:complete len:468 (+),score=135.13 GEMP01057241.1:75-1478(+)